MNGTWQTTGSGGGRGALIVLAVLVLLGSGAAAELATAVIAALIAIVVTLVLAIAALAAWLVWRVQRGLSAAPRRQGIIPAPVAHQLPGPERPALAPKVVEHHHYVHPLPGATAGEADWAPLIRGAVIKEEN